jgi:hypothetical protein
VRVQKADELNHQIERDVCELLAILFVRIRGEDLGAADIDEVRLNGWAGRHNPTPFCSGSRSSVTRIGNIISNSNGLRQRLFNVLGVAMIPAV